MRRPSRKLDNAAALIVVLVVLLAPLSSLAVDGQGKFTQHYPDSLFRIMENGRYSVEAVIQEHDLRVGKNAFDIIIHDNNDRDVDDANIRVVPWMVTMGHGVSQKPIITPQGRGIYRVENVVLSMGGSWALKILVEKDSVKDRIVFTFPDISTAYGVEHRHEARESAPPVQTIQ